MDGGVIRTSAATLHLARLENIYNRLLAVVRQSAPALAGMERVFAGIGGKSAVSLGEARGAAAAAIIACEVPIIEISALQIKKAITGAGRAGKQQTAQMIPFLLENAPQNPAADAADALACALAIMPATRTGQFAAAHLRLPKIRSRRRRARR